MERDDLIVMLSIFGGYGWMFLCAYLLPPPWDRYIGSMGMFFIIPAVLAQEVIAKLRTEKHQHFRMNDRFTNRIYDVFFKIDPRSVQDEETGWHWTRCELVYPFDYLGFGKVTGHIYLYHEKRFQDEFWFRDGIAYYMGQQVENDHTDNITVDLFSALYPSSEPIRRARTYLRFMVVSAGGELRDEQKRLRQDRARRILDELPTEIKN